MKIRIDFVTNSSSSSFLLARKPGLNEKQKAEIVKFVEENILGEVLLSPSSTKEEIESEFEENEYLVYLDKQDDIRKALDEGKTVYLGNVSYEECEYHLADLYEKIWKIVKDNSDGDFIAFDDDLSY